MWGGTGLVDYRRDRLALDTLALLFDRVLRARDGVLRACVAGSASSSSSSSERGPASVREMRALAASAARREGRRDADDADAALV